MTIEQNKNDAQDGGLRPGGQNVPDSSASPASTGGLPSRLAFRAARAAQARRGSLVAPVALTAAIVFAFATSNSYTLGQATTFLCFAMATVGLVLSLGVAGEFSLGQGAIFAVGAYVAAVCTTHYGLPFLLGCLIGIAGGVIVGLAVSCAALRVTGW